MIEGTWPKDDIRRAFVAGAAWWQFYEYGSTIWNSDRRLAEDEAEKRYNPKSKENLMNYEVNEFRFLVDGDSKSRINAEMKELGIDARDIIDRKSVV